MLFHELDKIKRNVIMTSITLMFAGLLLIILPHSYIPFLSIALGFGLLVVCVLSVFSFVGSKKVLMRYVELSAGLLSGILGIALWVFDDMFMTLLSWLVGTVPIFIGLFVLFHAVIYARRSGRRGWWLMVPLSLALIVFGIVIFAVPRLRAEGTVIQVTGGVMLSCAFISTLRLIWLSPVSAE
ncbi:MAG: DUF308 domain-containing protein [Ruminococcus sp.]|nr:DUF308 domain-containing protein [Ruminococcus sp.]